MIDSPDPCLAWLEAQRSRLGAPELALFERPPWNASVRVLSRVARHADAADTFGVARIDGGLAPGPRLSLACAADPRSAALDGEPIPDAFARWIPDAAPPAKAMVSALLHDLKNSLGAQSLLLSTAEKELRTASDGARAARFAMLIDSITLCRESVAVATDRAQLSQMLLSPASPPTLSGDAWLRLSLAGLSSEERERLDRTLSAEARPGPQGDPQSLVSIGASLCALASVGLRSARSTERSKAELSLQPEDELVLRLSVPGRCLDPAALWRAAVTGGGHARGEALIGLSEVLSSQERFEFASSRGEGTAAVVRAKRSSGVLR